MTVAKIFPLHDLARAQEASRRAGLKIVHCHGDEASPVRSEPGAYPRHYAGVAASLRQGAPPPVDPDDAVAGLEIIAAAQRSPPGPRSLGACGGGVKRHLPTDPCSPPGARRSHLRSPAGAHDGSVPTVGKHPGRHVFSR